MTHPLAYVHPEAKIAHNVKISSFVSVEKNVEIGEGTWIGSNVTIMEGAKIGKNVKIFPGAVISAIPQDLKFEGEITTVEIGDNTVIRECVTINRGTKSRLKTSIGKNCLLMAYVHVAHDCDLRDNVIIANSVQIAGHVVVDEYAYIGGTSAVHQFTKVGKYAMVAGGSLVRSDVPPYTKAGREPLSYSGINVIGMKRHGFASKKISEIQEIYRELYLKGMNNAEALKTIEIKMNPTCERDEIINFIRSSSRGIMKGKSHN